MKSYSLLIGARNGRRRFERSDAMLLEKITARHFPDGFTILDASGAWYDAERKSFRKEEARQVLICTATPRKLAAWCRELGEALAQKELLVIEVGPVRSFRIASPESALPSKQRHAHLGGSITFREIPEKRLGLPRRKPQ